MEYIKNSSLITKRDESKRQSIIEIRKSNPESYLGVTRLSDVFSLLPSGLIYKSETGMGATTLELMAKRHSIIVQPLKITASSKAKEHNAMYIGSPTKFDTDPLNKPDHIRIYDEYEGVEYKKFVVVADSLSKIVSALGPKIYEKYFILIDDVDSFQLDSSFRDSMEKCIDIYLNFPKNNRALLSATLMEFSNPLLKNEHLTVIKYDESIKRNIEILYTTTPKLLSCTYDRIVKIVNEFPGQRIFVALNSVGDSYNIACKLRDEEVLKAGSIKILCSASSQARAGDFYAQLDDTILPGTVNIFTSAYFTGFDIKESYHLISVSNSGSKYKVLSDRRLKQIVGRCRTGLLSETIIQDSSKPKEVISPTAQELERAANSLILTKSCIEIHFEENPHLKIFIKDITDRFLKTLEEKDIRFIRKDVNDIFQISYLNIDFHIEANRVRRELYSEKQSLFETLKMDGHIVSFLDTFSKTEVEDKKVSQTERDKEVQEIFEKIKGFKFSLDIEYLIRDEEQTLTALQKKIANAYKPLIGFVDEESTHKILLDSLIGKPDIRMFKRKVVSAEYATYARGHSFVDRLNHYFPDGKKLTSQQILEYMNLFLGEMVTGIYLNKAPDAKKFLNTLKKVNRCPTKKGEVYYIIKKDNPYDFKIIKKRESVGNTDLVSAIKAVI